MKATTQMFTVDRYDAIAADAEGVIVGTPPLLYLRGDADVMDRLAEAASEAARIQRSQTRLPGCEGSDLPPAERETRKPLLLVGPAVSWANALNATVGSKTCKAIGTHISPESVRAAFSGADTPVLLHADEMSAAASNALLGYLEAGRFCVLTTDDATRVLPTLRRFCEIRSVGQVAA